jgi:DNA-binding transcriptional regulator YiaG
MFEETNMLSEFELKSIAVANHLDGAESLLGDMLESIDIFQENIKFLLNSLEHGGQKRLAELLGVNQFTVSKWKNGQRPTESHVVALMHYVGLPRTADLNADCWFLSRDPVGAQAMRDWLIEQASIISNDQMALYFPALKRLLSDSQ